MQQDMTQNGSRTSYKNTSLT